MPFQAEGTMETAIITKLDRLTIKSIVDREEPAFYTVATSDGVDMLSSDTADGSLGKYMTSLSFRPLRIYTSNKDCYTGPVYVSSMGSVLSYLFGSITQMRGQTFPKLAFGEYLRQNLPSVLSKDSFAELLSAYEKHIQARVFSLTTGNEEMARLERAYEILKCYRPCISPTSVKNLILFHDSELHPIKRMDAKDLESVSIREGDETAGSCHMVGDGYVSSDLALTGRLVQAEGEFRLKFRRGKARRTTRRIDRTYDLKPDDEKNVRGRASIELGNFASWDGFIITKPEIRVKVEGDLL